MLNARYSGLRTITSRRGNKVEDEGLGGYGTLKYAKSNTSTGAVDVEILAVGSKLYKRTAGTITVAYSGAGVALAGCYVSGTSWHFYLLEDGATVLDYDAGVGYDEASIEALSDLKTAIDAITGFSATIVGDATSPAAFIPTLPLTAVGSSLAITYYYLAAVNQPATAADPFAGTYAARNNAEFEICSHVNLNNVLFIGSKYDGLKKYDGQKVYRAGIPQPLIYPTATPGAAGNVNVGTHQLWSTYYQKDAQGNEVEGPITAAGAVTVAGSAATVAVDVRNIQNTTGFNTDMAVVNGPHAAVNTMNVTGCTLKVGDTAYLYDGVSASYVERAVTASSATLLTIAGDPVTVANGAVISANLRVRLWASVAAGTEPYLVVDAPNNSGAATQTLTYNISDATLLTKDRYLTPLTAQDLPPQGGYLTSHQGSLVVAGIVAAPNTVYWSEPGSPEYFDYSEYSEECQTISNEPISGVASARETLAVFKPNAYFVFSGTLWDGNYRKDLASTSIGAASHASIVDVRDATYFLNSSNIYQLDSAGRAMPIGDSVAPLLTTKAYLADQQFKFKRVVAVNDIKEELVMWFLPCESTANSETYANDNSRVLVYDYYRGAWLLWSNINMAGGAVVDDEQLHYTARAFNSLSSALSPRLSRRIDRYDDYAYVDHTDPIEWFYLPGWESLNDPSTFKKANRLRAFSSDPTVSPSFVVTVKTELDYQPGSYHTVDTLTFGSAGSGSGWSITPWGTLWGDPATPVAKTRLKATRCQAIRVGFYHETLYRRPIISGWEVEFVAPFRPEIKD